MHDVRIALDLLQHGDPDAAELGNASDIVAAEVDQHPVLGEFLLISEQFPLQGQVLILVPSPPPGSCDRTHERPAIFAAHHDLRRGAQQGGIVPLEIEEVGRGIQSPEAAVDLERVHLHRFLEPLGQDHLEDVAGEDMLLRPVYRRLEGLSRAIRLHPLGDGALRERVKGVEDILSDNGTAQGAFQLIQPALGVLPDGLPLLLRLPGADVGVGYEKEPVLGVVKGDQHIVEMQPGIGELRLPRMPVGNVLDVADRVVAQVAHRPAGQRRQAGHRRGHAGIDRVLQDLEEIA